MTCELSLYLLSLLFSLEQALCHLLPRFCRGFFTLNLLDFISRLLFSISNYLIIFDNLIALLFFDDFFLRAKWFENLMTLVTYSIDWASQAEIAYLDRAILIDEHICWFKISVQDMPLMNVLDGMKEIP